MSTVSNVLNKNVVCEPGLEGMSGLIGLIYDAAADIEVWPDLLEQLFSFIPPAIDETESAAAQNKQFGGYATSELVSMLAPHFTRAVESNRALESDRIKIDVIEGLLEHFPFAVIVTDAKAKLIGKNQRADEILEQKRSLFLSDDIVRASSCKQTRTLHQLISNAAGEEGGRGIMPLSEHSDSMAHSIFVLPHSYERYALLVISTPVEVVSVRVLKEFYGVTEAEAKLLQGILGGHNLEELAVSFGRSRNTLRTQLQSIYAKTGTCRQGDLIRLITTGPAILGNIESLDPSVPIKCLHKKNIGFLDSCEEAEDFLFSSFGPKEGHPVIFTHGVLKHEPDEAFLYRHGIRLIIPVRNSGEKQFTLLGWAEYTERLINYLNLKEISLLGYGVGGPFALAAAHRLGRRVTHISLVNSLGPINDLDSLAGMIPMNRLSLSIGLYMPELLSKMIGLMVAAMCCDNQRYFEYTLKQLCPSDAMIAIDPHTNGYLVEGMREITNNYGVAWAKDYATVSRSWGFDSSEIKTPVTLWHGEQDHFITPNMGRELANQLPNCHANFIEGCGHFLICSHWEKIIASLVNNVRT